MHTSSTSSPALEVMERLEEKHQKARADKRAERRAARILQCTLKTSKDYGFRVVLLGSFDPSIEGNIWRGLQNLELDLYAQ